MDPDTVFLNLLPELELEPMWPIFSNQNLEDLEMLSLSQSSNTLLDEELTTEDYQPNAVRFSYEARTKFVQYPPNATYDEIISIALLEFGVPLTCKDRVKVSTHYGMAVTKESFEKFLAESPSPDIEFYIKINPILRILKKGATTEN